MKYKCEECGTEFEGKMYVQCPKCGEQMKVKPIYTYGQPRPRAEEEREEPSEEKPAKKRPWWKVW